MIVAVYFLAGWLVGFTFTVLLVVGGTRPQVFPQFLPEAETWRLAELA